MGSITINGKKVIQWVIGGKTVQSLAIGGKVLSFRKPNTFEGSFWTPDGNSIFSAITDTVLDYQFGGQGGITGIGLPYVETIGVYAFRLSPLTRIDIPKATTIGNEAFKTVVNAATTNITMNKKFNTAAEKDRIFRSGNWNHITFHWLNDDGSPYVPPQTTGNSFTGTFSTPAKQAEFIAITDTVQYTQFANEPGLTSISLPNVASISLDAFKDSPLTNINVPKATAINGGAFSSVVNAATTIVTMNHKFDIADGDIVDAGKNQIFGSGHWDRITFHWTNDDGTPYVPPTWHFGGANPHATQNDWLGTFSTPAKQAEFEAITGTITSDQFTSETGIVGISLPNMVNIEESAFSSVPLTYINIPKATTIGDGAFDSIHNVDATKVWMNKKFDADETKDEIFGAWNWDQITFHWLNDDGTPNNGDGEEIEEAE